MIESYLDTNPNLTLASVGFLIDKNFITLGLRKKVSWGLGANLISGIGGKVGDSADFKNETVLDSLVREMQEEIHVTPTRSDLVAEIVFLFPYKEKWNQKVFAYLVKEWQGEPKETESIKPSTYKQDQIPWDLMWDDNKYWLKDVLAGKKLKATFLYTEDNKTVCAYKIEFVVQLAH